MCILCVIQKWSRRVATMLPWLVIPLIGLWALSQLLPPAFRFEITSPRLACVFVLLVTLFWYEVLMPQLSAWRVRRNAQLRERKRYEALELQKLRKTATRKCRNCLTPYRDQNPGGGKFMCSYCGHISKRPVLDLPIPPGLAISNAGIIKDLFGKGGKILNGKAWSDNGSICPVWLEHGNWVVSGSLAGKSNSNYSRKSVGLFGGNEQCLDERSYPHAYIFPRKWLTSFMKSIRWIWRKLFRISSSREDALSEAEHRAMLAKRGENGGAFHESRGEKARRKAEEKRQARLEKELLEEEERKQREEVARLVEERRRLRDEKLEAENRAKGLSSLREKDRKEAEKRRQDKRKEKDKASSKSNSDVEEMEKKAGKENDRKRDTEKRSEADKRDCPRTVTDNVKGQGAEIVQGLKSNSPNTTRGNAGARYLDRMRGTFLSSSKAFTGGSFFGKVTRTPLPVSKEKSHGSIDQFQVSASKRELCTPERVPPRVAANGDDKSVSRSQVNLEPQQKTAPKSWQHLFTKSPAAPVPSNSNVISRPSAKTQLEANNSQFVHQLSSATTYDNPIDFGFPSPFNISSFPNGSMNNMSGLAKDSIFPHVGDNAHDLLPEEPELFEDPCYIPDPVSLLGPVSESLDNFQLDRGSGFIPEEPVVQCGLMGVPASMGTGRPSSIESPISMLRVADEKQNNPCRVPASPKFHNMHPFRGSDLNTASETGTWQMWSTSPLGQDGLGLVGGPASWIHPLDHSISSKEELLQPSSQKTMASLFRQDDSVVSDKFQRIYIGNYQNGGAFASAIPGPNDRGPRLQMTCFPPLSGGENRFPMSHPVKETSEIKMLYGGTNQSAANHPMDLSPTSCWTPKKEWGMKGGGGDDDEGVGDPSVMKPPPVGGLYSTPDVQSFWSFE